MIAADVLAMPAHEAVTLVKALARAFRWRPVLEDGSYSTIKELAAGGVGVGAAGGVRQLRSA